VLAWTRRTAPTCIIQFEDLIANPGKELERALVALGLPTLASRGPLPSFQELHKAVPWFFRKGKVGGWREEMPLGLQELFWQHHREAMETLGYAIDDSSGSGAEVKYELAPSTAKTSGPGLAYFFSPNYERHNRAVLVHLESLGLALSNCRVLELGSGPGDHTGFYAQRGCAIVSVDARPACLNLLLQRFPDVQTVRCDLNTPAQLRDLGIFDIVHCYGILYHLEKPAELISFMGKACAGVAVVETCVSPDACDHVVSEESADYTQSSSGLGCRPTRKWVFEQLRQSFPFVYQTITQPPNPEFPTNWNDLADATPLVRAVFVASKHPLDLPSLSAVLLDNQEQLEIGAENVPSVAPGRCGEWISEITSVWAEVESREKDLKIALATINEQAQRVTVLEATAAERLAAMQDRDREIQSRELRIVALEAAATERLVGMEDRDREVQIREQRIAELEAVAAERLVGMEDRDREIQSREQRIAELEAVAAERLVGMEDRDREVQIREQRIAKLEAVAAERLVGMQDRDREIQSREQRIAALEAVAAERLVGMEDRDREVQIREQRIARLESMLTQPLAATVGWDREISIREERIAGLEATAAERLAAMLDRDREIEIREQRIAHLESVAAERLTAMLDRDREIEIREQRIVHLESISAERLAVLPVDGR
jgi:SAM-dependent methyltransferase